MPETLRHPPEQEKKPDNQPWIKEYQEKEWETLEIAPDSNDYKELLEVSEYIPRDEITVCTSDSQRAREKWEQVQSTKKLFFYDLEQELALNYDRTYGMDNLRRLTTEWKNYPKGALVMTLYRGVDQKPPFFTFCIEKK